MAFRTYWHTPQQILCIELEGTLSLDDFNHMNQAVWDQLGDEASNQPVALLVDITRPSKMPQAFQYLRESQVYTQRRDLKMILVVGSNKFNRLMMMLTFNLCKPSLWFFDNIEQALALAKRSGLAAEV